MTVMLLSPLPILIATLVAGQGLEIRSGTDCPSSQAIVEKLVPLLAGQGEDGDVAWVEGSAPEPSQPPALRLRLVRAGANVIADRQLPVHGNCEEMADTVAAVLAAWETPATPLPAVAGVEAHDQPAKKTEHLQLWLGAAGGAGLLGGIAATGNLELLLVRTGSHLLARAAMTGQTTRQLDLNPGEVVWRRTYGSLGLGWQARRPTLAASWQASADLDLLLGWLTASGRGFAPDTQASVFEYGFGAGLRGQRNLGGWALWIEARAHLWPAPERAVLTGGSPSTTQLPKVDILASFGISRIVLR